MSRSRKAVRRLLRGSQYSLGPVRVTASEYSMMARLSLRQAFDLAVRGVVQKARAS